MKRPFSFGTLLVAMSAVGWLVPLASGADNRSGGARVALVAGGGTDAGTKRPLLPGDARLTSPFGVDFDRQGNLYLVEMTAHRVRRLDVTTGKLALLAGTGDQGATGDGGPALAAKFNGLHNLAVSREGDIYLADTWNNRVRKIELQNGRVSTIAGTGQKGFSGDGGLATAAQFGGIYCVSLTPRGTELLLADLDNRRIRAVDLASGKVRTVAGNGAPGIPPDGAKAAEAPLVDPRAVIADGAGRIYILERSGNALRIVERDGTIQTVVGLSGKAGLSGDDGDAREATLNGPKHLCLDRNGDVLIADTENHVVRRYMPRNGRIVRVAGTGRKGTRGVGGPPLEVELNQPHGVYVHSDGSLYISDSSNHRVLKIAAAVGVTKP
jgi:sugar lactone lactonase YvrE